MRLKGKYLLKIIFLGVGLFATSLLADSEVVRPVPEFLGGLNVSQIIKCEKIYSKVCPAGKTVMSAQQSACIEKKMAKDKRCIQASKIRQLIGYPAMELKKYGPVTVFSFTTMADGIDVFYMVDSKGQLIPLNTSMDLSKEKNFSSLKEKYPEIALTGFLYWTKINEDLFPKTRILPTKNQQLLFKQELRSPDCVACPKVGVVEMAYEFNSKGAYLHAKPLSITPVN